MPNTIKPDDVKIGDRVRITVEGVVSDCLSDGGLDLKLTGADSPILFSPSELAHATIERIPEVIEAGDVVSVKDWTGEWTVLGIDGGSAWLKRVGVGDRLTRYISSLTLIRKAVQS